MPITPTKRTPIESICSGQAAGIWFVDPDASRIQFNIEQLWGLFVVRGKFDCFQGCIEVSRAGSVGATLAVNAGSVSVANVRAKEQLRSAGLFAAGSDPTIIFDSSCVFLVMPDEAWVSGTLTVAGRAWPAVFETTLRMDEGAGSLVVEAKIRADCFAPGAFWAPRIRCMGAAVLGLHLVFVRR